MTQGMLAMRKENVLHTTTVGGVLVTCTGPGRAGAGVGELRLEGGISEFYMAWPFCSYQTEEWHPRIYLDKLMFK